MVTIEEAIYALGYTATEVTHLEGEGILAFAEYLYYAGVAEGKARAAKEIIGGTDPASVLASAKWEFAEVTQRSRLAKRD